jgi:hypothetical protein
MSDLVQSALQLGVCAVLALFYTWQAHHREIRLQSQIDELNTYVRTTFEGLVTRAVSVIERQEPNRGPK